MTETTTNIFEKAARLSLRFVTPTGRLAVEDLFTLPLQTAQPNRVSLDAIARDLHRKLQDVEVSFVSPGASSDQEMQLKMDLVKSVIATKQAENADRVASAVRAATKQKIMALITDKKDEAMKEMSVADLEKMFASL